MGGTGSVYLKANSSFKKKAYTMDRVDKVTQSAMVPVKAFTVHH